MLRVANTVGRGFGVDWARRQLTRAALLKRLYTLLYIISNRADWELHVVLLHTTLDESRSE